MIALAVLGWFLVGSVVAAVYMRVLGGPSPSEWDTTERCAAAGVAMVWPMPVAFAIAGVLLYGAFAALGYPMQWVARRLWR